MKLMLSFLRLLLWSSNNRASIDKCVTLDFTMLCIFRFLRKSCWAYHGSHSISRLTGYPLLEGVPGYQVTRLPSFIRRCALQCSGPWFYNAWCVRFNSWEGQVYGTLVSFTNPLASQVRRGTCLIGPQPVATITLINSHSFIDDIVGACLTK